MYLGDIAVGATIQFMFTTRRFTTGAPHTLAGTPAVRVYKNASDTEDDSGITLTADFDSRTGLNHVAIDTSADGTFYAAGSDCMVVITAGTVDSVSVVGEVVAHFSISNRPVQGIGANVITATSIATDAIGAAELADGAITAATFAAGAIDATAIANGAIDAAAFAADAITSTVIADNAITANKIAANAITSSEIADGAITSTKFAAGAITATVIATDAIDADAIADGAITSGVFASGAITADAIAANAIGASELAADAAAEIADAVWDEDATGHQTGGTFGQAIGDPGADTTTIYQSVVTDAAGANIAADIIDIEGKVDDLETRLGTPSDLGSGATVAANLVDIESQTDDIGVAGAGLTNINLPDQTMNIVGNITGNLSGSVGSVTGNVGGTINGLTATALADFFDTDSGTTFASAVAGSVVKEIADNAGGSALTEAGIADAVWDEARAGHTNAGSFGQGVASVQGNVTGSVGSVATGGIAAASFAAGAIDAAAIATGAIDADAIAANAIGASELAADAANEIADAILDRDMSTGTDSGSTTVRTPRQALRFLRNKWTIAAGTLTVTKEDDSTSSWSSTVTTDNTADPVTANDPAGP